MQVQVQFNKHKQSIIVITDSQSHERGVGNYLSVRNKNRILSFPALQNCTVKPDTWLCNVESADRWIWALYWPINAAFRSAAAPGFWRADNTKSCCWATCKPCFLSELATAFYEFAVKTVARMTQLSHRAFQTYKFHLEISYKKLIEHPLHFQKILFVGRDNK